MKRWITLVILVLALVLVSRAPAGAREVQPKPRTEAAPAPPSSDREASNLSGILFAAFLVFFMQTGFALVETGMVRSKNVVHTMAMNLMVYSVGALGFWACGFAILWGDAGSLFLAGRALNSSLLAAFLFQVMFMDTAATIPTGAMAERYRFSAFLLLGFFMSMLLYPVYAHWVWSEDGWLARLGVNFGLGHGHVDYAGSSVVHMVGGFTALVGVVILGPRIGKYRPNGTPNPMPAHNVPMYMVGTLILAFGWFGFNTGNSLATGDPNSARIAVNTLLASAAGAFASMAYIGALYRRPDPSFLCNGLLAGLVAVTASCAYVEPWAAVVIGGIGGALVVWSCLCLERTFRIDDPVGAVSVHGINGIWGVLALGLFADGTYAPGGQLNGVAGNVTGLFYGDAAQLVAQCIGVAANLLWVLPVSFIFFRVAERLIGNRVTPQVEVQGLDVPELGALGYINQELKVPESRVVQMPVEPRPARVPPSPAQGFTLVIEGLSPEQLAQTWNDLCQPSDAPPAPEFLAVYHYMTTVKGNRFRFRGGNPDFIRDSLQKLLQTRLPGQSIQVRMEP